MKLVNLVPLKEGPKQARELADRNSLQQLQAMYDQLMRDMEQEAEPEGGPIADQYADQMQDIEDAMQMKRGKTKDVPYDVAIGRMSRDEFEKSSKFNRMNETTEKAWNAIDVSRKAEKEISNKEWNERTGKKLDMLKKLNDAGKFKKDFDDERLQGWVDQNYSWQKLSKQFKLNEMYEGTPTVFDDQSMDELLDIILKYVKDPDDAQAELDRFDDGGFDAMSDMVTANLLRDPEYKAWYDKVHSIKETNKIRKAIRKIIKEQNFDDRLRAAMGAGEFEKATTPQMPEAAKVWDALVKTFSDNKNDSISYLNSDKTYRSIAITAIFRAMNF